VRNGPPSLEPEPPALDVKLIVSTLGRHGVHYLLIGGLGATLYGAERVTQDIDVLPRTDIENLSRLAAAPRDLGAFLKGRRVQRRGGESSAGRHRRPVAGGD
jgi:hypothetical protein